MATPVTKNIVLPELSDDQLGYINTDYWTCPSCSNTEHYENWSSLNYYDIDHLIKLLGELKPDALVVGQETERYGTLASLLRDRVAEHSDRQQCPNCSQMFEQEDLKVEPQFDCVSCGENWTNPHDALVCCNQTCDFMECGCLAGIRVESDTRGLLHPLRNDQVRETTFYRCHCNRNDPEAACGFLVCVVCHTTTVNEQRTWHHDCLGVPQGWPEVQVKVEPEEIICTCETGFCCQTHHVHFQPHVLCDAA